jgi:hypothetical protein
VCLSHCHTYNVKKIKGEGKVVPVLDQALHSEDIWGSGCINPHFIDLSTSCRWVVSLSCFTEPVWMMRRGDKSYPYWDSNSNPSAIQPIASHYTNCTIPAPSVRKITLRNRADKHQSPKPDSRNASDHAAIRLSYIYPSSLNLYVSLFCTIFKMVKWERFEFAYSFT